MLRHYCLFFPRDVKLFIMNDLKDECKVAVKYRYKISNSAIISNVIEELNTNNQLVNYSSSSYV